MVSRRLAREAGHRRKFLCVVDGTPECDRAVVYAARRAVSTSGALVLLYVIEPIDPQQWRGVEEVMRSEAMDEARRELAAMAERLGLLPGDVAAELVIREGQPAAAIHKLIDEDRDIAILVLASAVGNDGPGPLISSIASRSNGGFPIPVTIVPGGLSDEELTAVT